MKVVLFVLVIGLTGASGQTVAQPRTVDGGILNGKANNLARPRFPAAARLVRACGTVNVRVAVDVEGTVISARPVSGHPLLRSAAVDAARSSSFLPTALDGRPVAVTGVIVYVFHCNLTDLQLGYRLSSAAIASEFPKDFPDSGLLANWPTEWTGERVLVEAIQVATAIRNAKTEGEAEPSTRESTEQIALLDVTRVTSADSFKPTPGEIYEVRDPKAAAVKLVELLRARFAGEPRRLWWFELGVIAGRLESDSGDELTLIAAAEKLESHIARAPDGTYRGFIEKAEDLLRACRELPAGVDRTATIRGLASKFAW